MNTLCYYSRTGNKYKTKCHCVWHARNENTHNIHRYTYYVTCVRRPLALLVYTPLSRYMQQRFGITDSPVHCYRYLCSDMSGGRIPI